MNTLLTKTLGKLRLGPAQQAGNLTVFPLLATPSGGPDYMTLAAASGTSKIRKSLKISYAVQCTQHA
ncbi:MAG: hypothetical protein QF565_06805 [Arenicellales bacterium]|jgi:hypothetical protein|nr:hypothetical protein [Arenicellales bacterium]